MARYRSLWLEVALDQYTSLPAQTRKQVDARVEELRENPRQRHSAYDERTDQWTTTYGSGAGLIVYAIVPERTTVIILRLV